MGKYSSRSDLSLFPCLKVKQCRCAPCGSFSSSPFMHQIASSLNLVSVLGGKLEIIFECFLVCKDLGSHPEIRI